VPCGWSQPLAARVEALAFDSLGSRLYAGDAAGLVISPDGLPARALRTSAPAHTCDCRKTPVTRPGAFMKMTGPGRRKRNLCWLIICADCAELPTIPCTSIIPMQVHEIAVDLRGSCPEPLKKLRACAHLAGSPIAQLAPHPGGRHLVALSRSGNLASLDLKLLILNRRFGSVRAGTGPLKAAISPGAPMSSRWAIACAMLRGTDTRGKAYKMPCYVRQQFTVFRQLLSPPISPWSTSSMSLLRSLTQQSDGRYLLCGSEDGTVTCWLFESGASARLPNLELGGAPVTALDWSRWARSNSDASSCSSAARTCALRYKAPVP
jgi:hypothetical protein